MSKIAGAVMIALFLVAFAAILGGIEAIAAGRAAADASGEYRAIVTLAALLPALALWGLALASLKLAAALIVLALGCGAGSPPAPPAPEPTAAERQQLEAERYRTLSSMLVMLLAQLDAEAVAVPADSAEAADLRQRKADALAALAVVNAHLAQL